MATTPTRLLTFAEFEQLPDPKTGRYELRHGELVTVAFPVHERFLAQRGLRRLLEAVTGDEYEVETRMPFRAQPEHEYRVADVGLASEIIDKKTLCLENGSREFWVVDIEHRQVEVSTPDGRTQTYKAGQRVPLYFAPGTHLAVDAAFA
jgi:Uma2 family endonuclease